MKKIKFYLAIFSLLPMFSVAQSDKCKSGEFSSHKNNSVYSSELTNYKKTNDIPGAIIAIKKQGEPLWIGADGKKNLESNESIQTCTTFRIGSITKVFVAAVALKLRESGRLQLDKPITFYLPEIKNEIPQSDKISLHMLLNHSNGIIDPKNDDPDYLAFITQFPERVDSMSIDDRLKKYVFGKPLTFAPGTASHYSNTGYWLVGKAIEKATKKSMQQLLNEMIFKPLKMTDSYYEERNDPKVAHGYFVVEGQLTDVTKWDKADGDGDPSSGIVSSAQDLFTFGDALFSGKIINDNSMKQMLETLKLESCPNKDCDFGLGIENWNVGKHKGFGKNGSSVGYEVNWVYIPETKLSIITYANKGGGSDKSFIERIAN